jgi:hypothetical protein
VSYILLYIYIYISSIYIYILLTLIQIAESDVELNTLKAMVKKAVLLFYPKDPSSDVQTPQLLDGLPNRCLEVILANMKQAASLTLGILKSLYPRADLDAAGDGFATTCTDEEALKLMEDSALTANHIVDMVPIDMS